MCGYTQDASNTLDWDIKSGKDNLTMNRMPDHTTQSLEGKHVADFDRLLPHSLPIT